MTRIAKIGIFFIVITALTTFYMMKSADWLVKGGTYKLYAYLDDATGLLEDSEILIAGVAIGKIRVIELEGERAKVTLEIYDKVPLYKDAFLYKDMQSMLGTSMLQLSPGKDKANPLKDGDWITHVDSKTGLNYTIDKAKSIANRTEGIVNNIGDFVEREDFQKKMSELVDVLTRVSKSSAQNVEANLILMRVTMKNMAEITGKVNANFDANLKQMELLIANTIALTDKANKLIGDNDKTISESLLAVRDSLKSLSTQVATAQDAINSAKATMQNMEEISGRIKNGEGNVGKALKDEKLYENISNIAEKASDYADSTLGMQVQVDFHSEFRALDQNFQNIFNLRLQPRADRYYLLGVVDDPSGRLTEKTTVTEITDPTVAPGTYTVIEKEKKTENSLKLNLQVARIFGDWTLRGGIIESSGGAAVDYTPWKYWTISSEIFDLTSGDTPNLRLLTNVYPFRWTDKEPFNWLYLTGGSDDILRNSQRDYFVGIGLTFTDNDLKGVIGSAGGAAGAIK